jgi:tRNA G18 (ribose-2'-O)-methylase SpoU
LVRRLVDSGLRVESFLVDKKYLDEATEWLPADAEVYVIDGQQVSELIGFDFHRGFLACGIRPNYLAVDRENMGRNLERAMPIESTLLPAGRSRVAGRSWMGVMLIGVQDPENMGSILRSCAALGVSDIFIGPECVDPFARRVLRVSMGNAFKLQFYDASDSIGALQHCH